MAPHTRELFKIILLKWTFSIKNIQWNMMKQKIQSYRSFTRKCGFDSASIVEELKMLNSRRSQLEHSVLYEIIYP